MEWRHLSRQLLDFVSTFLFIIFILCSVMDTQIPNFVRTEFDTESAYISTEFD